MTTTSTAAAVQESIPTVLRNKPSAVVKPLPCSKTTRTDRPVLVGVVNQADPVPRSRRNGGGERQARVGARRTVSTRTTNAEPGSNRPEATGTQQREEDEQQQQRGGRGATRTTRTRVSAAGTTRAPQPTAAVGQNQPKNSKTSESNGATNPLSVTTRTTNTTRPTAAVAKVKKTREAGADTGSVAVSRPLRVVGLAVEDIRKTDGRCVNTRSRRTTTTSNVAAGAVRPVPKPRKNVRPTTGAEPTMPNQAAAGTNAGPKQTTAGPNQAAAGTNAGPNKTAAGPNRATAVTKDGPLQPWEASRPSSLELVPFVPEASIDITEDPSMCGEYAAEVYVYHRQLEEQRHYLVCATFMEHQTNITGSHRRVLVDWLTQVSFKYHLLQETMILTVDILDRYLQIVIIPKPKLQLVGLASLLISSKVEEIYAPSVYDLVHIAAHTYTREEILKMEKTILHELDFRILKPYPIHFLRRYSRLSRTDTNVHHLAKYFIDLSLLETETSSLLPSKKAAAAFIIASSLANVQLYGTSGKKVWTKELVRHSGYNFVQLKDPVMALLRAMATRHLMDNAKAIRERYVKNAPTEQVKSLIKTGLEKTISAADHERVVSIIAEQTES